jgi:Ca2+-binding RTX toxin-like protein
MIGEPARQRTTRRARLLLIALLSGAAAAVLGGSPSHAAATCTWNATTQNVGIVITSAAAEEITIGRTAGSPGTLDVTGVTGPCDGAPLNEIGTISITVADTSDQNQTVIIDQTNGEFEPGNGAGEGDDSEIQWTIDLDGGTDNVQILGTPTGDHIRVGTSGVNLNADEVIGPDFDITLTDVESLLVDGANGNDTVSGAGGFGTGTATTLPLTVIGGANNDILTGGNGANTLSYANAGAAVTVDLSVTTAQNTGGAGTDTISGFQNLTGSPHNDTLTGTVGATGDNVIDGGSTATDGTDTVSYANATALVTVDLTIGAAQSTGGGGDDQLVDIENVVGSPHNDTLTGNSSANVLEGGLGDDTLDGAGNTSDTASYANAPAAVTIDLSIVAPTAQNAGGAGSDKLTAIENVTGSAFADTLTGDPNNNTLDGGAGNDPLISGAGGNDTLKGGTGNETLVGGAGNDAFDGEGGTDTVSFASTTGTGVTVSLTAGTASGDGSDTFTANSVENILGSPQGDALTGDGNNNTIDGGNDNDTIEGRGGDDTLTGGGGTNTLSYANAGATVTVDLAIVAPTTQNTGGAGTDTISGFHHLTGSASADVLKGDATANTLTGGGGNDTLDGRTGADSLLGEGGNDTLIGGSGGDSLTGGNDSDTADYSTATAGLTASLATPAGNNGDAAGDTYTTIENLTGSDFADTLTGDDSTATDNVLDGGVGNDIINAGAGDDTLIGGPDNDQLGGQGDDDTADYSGALAGISVDLRVNIDQNTGGAGTDRLVGIEHLTGSAFNDTLSGTSSANTLDGGGGTGDTVGYASATGSVSVNLTTGTATGDGADTISNFENAVGSPQGDTLVGSAGANTLDGGAGDDTLSGVGDNDTLIGGANNDVLDGGAGTNTASYLTASAGVTVDLGVTAPTAQNTVGAGNDTLSNIHNATGSNLDDSLTGDGTANALSGLAGNDTLIGKDGNDTLTGGDGTADKVDYNGNTAVVVDLAGPAPQATGGTGIGSDTIATVEDVTGSTVNDTIGGNLSNNNLVGNGGTDTVTFANITGTGVTVDLTAGTATGAGTDTLDDFTHIIGSPQADTLAGTTANNTIDGGAGIDTVSYSGAISGVTVDLTDTTPQNTVGAGTDTLTNLESLTGSPLGDILKGTSSANTLTGGSGNDTLIGGNGADALIGGDDTDTADYSTASTGVEADLATPANNSGDAAGDTYATVENLLGSPQGDTLTGDGGVNTLTGGDGNDIFDGGANNDTERGGSGNDSFYQGTAKNGSDDMSGGSGTDDVTYDDRPTTAFVTFDNVANDGEAGEGDNARSDIETSSLAVFPPDPPTNVQATPGKGSATVTWSAPANTGGTPITGYTVTSNPDNKTASAGPEARSATVAGLRNGVTYTFTVNALNSAGTGNPSAPSNAVTPTDPATTQGYSLLGNDGAVYSFGKARNFGSIPGLGTKLNQPPIGIAYTPSGQGYWIVAQDGGIFTFGDAGFFGSTGNVKLNAPVLGMEPTPSGKGYWLFAGDGGIFSFGDAQFFGSMGASKLNAPVVGMAATSTGKGYWLVAQDGGIFSFGDAQFFGSTGSIKLNQPVFDMAPMPDNAGYRLVARDGGLFSFGSAESKFFGSAANANPATVIGIANTPSGNGYWIVDRNGVTFAFGDAAALGDLRGLGLTAVGFAAPK